jgi:hypothetical protein
MGATGADDGGHAIFPDAESGFKAASGLLASPSYSGLTLAQIGRKWADGDEGWARNVSRVTGIPLDAVPTPEQREMIVRRGIPVAEGHMTGVGGGGAGTGFGNIRQLPRSQMPYPDALDRDWGQQVARSPWGAVMAAGARMAQTTGPVGTAIGAGVESGLGYLQGQRGALRSEEAINQKVNQMYQQAQIHLDAYRRISMGTDKPTAPERLATRLTALGSFPDEKSALEFVVRSKGDERAWTKMIMDTQGITDVSEARRRAQILMREDFGGGTSAPQKNLRPATEEEKKAATDAITGGKDPIDVRNRLRENGIDPSGV